MYSSCLTIALAYLEFTIPPPAPTLDHPLKNQETSFKTHGLGRYQTTPVFGSTVSLNYSPKLQAAKNFLPAERITTDPRSAFSYSPKPQAAKNFAPAKRITMDQQSTFSYSPKLQAAKNFAPAKRITVDLAVSSVLQLARITISICKQLGISFEPKELALYATSRRRSSITVVGSVMICFHLKTSPELAKSPPGLTTRMVLSIVIPKEQLRTEIQNISDARRIPTQWANPIPFYECVWITTRRNFAAASRRWPLWSSRE